MHYKNGRLAKNGDKVILLRPYGPPISGILYDATPGFDACNGYIAITSSSDVCPNLSQCLHFDDVRHATVPDSTPMGGAI
jgi:hypothetical protein